MTTTERSPLALATIASVAAAVVVSALLLWLAGAPPLEAAGLILEGAFGSADKIANTLLAWTPLVLASAGLVVTFAAGMWNIGVEGQIVAGAIAASFVAREMPGSPWIVVPLTIVAGAIGGALWALLAGVLRTKGNVNEIFGGLGLDFLALGLTVYLVIGPWSREGTASTGGTDIFREEAWLPTTTLFGTEMPLLAVTMAIVGTLLVYYLLRGTRFGLRLKAVGRNPRSAFVLGIPNDRYILNAFALGGALAGIAGTVQVTGFQHKLVPAISGGYGFLGILVVLLAGFSAKWIAPIALFFIAVSVGSTTLELRLGLDSAFGGVLQGVIVLFVMFGTAIAAQRRRHTTARSGET
ncbi:MAG: ABC transporter permease [Actinomycetota bacterium]|nr:ABC transporter permease [Actinomycetota bacterium]